MGKGLTRLYGDFFHFPFLIFRHDADIYVIAGLVSVLAAVAGALKAVREVLALAPAIAMQPPAAPRYRKLFSTLRGHSSLFSQLTIMSLRHIIRRPLRAGATSLGIAMGLGLLVTALLSFDSVELMIDVAFFRTERQQATLTSPTRSTTQALQSVQRMPGVHARRTLPDGGRAASQRAPVAASCRSSANPRTWTSPASSISIDR